MQDNSSNRWEGWEIKGKGKLQVNKLTEGRFTEVLFENIYFLCEVGSNLICCKFKENWEKKVSELRRREKV